MMKVTFARKEAPKVRVSELMAGKAFIDEQGDLCVLVSVADKLQSLVLTAGRTALSVPYMYFHSPNTKVTPVDIEIIVHQ